MRTPSLAWSSPRGLRLSLFLLVALAPLVSAGLARAQAQPAASAANMEAQELEARTACAAGDVDKGIAILARVFAETSDYTWVYNQGRCYQQNGKIEQALNRFREYLRRGQNLSAEDKSEVEGFIKELEGEQVKKTGAPASAPAASAPASASPGPDATVTATAAPTAEGTAWPWQKKVGLGLMAGAVASLGVGVVFHIAREGKAKEFIDAGCGTGNLEVGPGCRAKNDAVKGPEILAIVGYAGAVVLGGTGALLWWMAGRSTTSESASDNMRLACAPRLGDNLGDLGVGCGVRF